MTTPPGDELATRDDTAIDAIDPHPEPTYGSALLLWAQEARQANLIAQSLAETSFVPQSLRGKPQDITACILAGQELGLRPMASLRSMDIISGTPSLRAHAMRGLVQSHGHAVELVESDDHHAVVRGKRAGLGAWQQVEWTIERATQLGLTSKDQWKKQPRTMLIARATSEVCRLIASDALYAMPYATEELDGEPDPPAPAQARVTVDDLPPAKPKSKFAEAIDALPEHVDLADPSDPTDPWAKS